MKVVLLAGGLGTRIGEESQTKPKPMVEIGGMPIIWHIMKIYSHYGYNEFIVCCGYKSYVIKDYFANYLLHESDVTFDYRNNSPAKTHDNELMPWCVTLAETGMENMTGSRIKQIQKYIPEGESFMLTYGDGVSDINIAALVEHHKKHGKIGTMTAVQPPAKFGVLDIDANEMILDFKEKPESDAGWINGGFMVLNYDVFQYIDDNPMRIFEREPLEQLAKDRELTAYRHRGFWMPMDTIRDRNVLEELWKREQAPWKIWQ